MSAAQHSAGKTYGAQINLQLTLNSNLNPYEESPRGAATGLTSCHLFLVTSDISPELIPCADGLRFLYVGVRAWGSKLALAIYGTRRDLWPLKLWP